MHVASSLLEKHQLGLEVMEERVHQRSIQIAIICPRSARVQLQDFQQTFGHSSTGLNDELNSGEAGAVVLSEHVLWGMSSEGVDTET